MKKYFLTGGLYFITLFSHSQTLTTTNLSWIGNGVGVERSIKNFITICTMPKKDFESQMKAVGANILIGENFCIDAVEQLSLTGTLDDEHYIFQKCENIVQIIWYGSEQASGFKNFMEKLQPYYLKTIDNIRGYAVAIGEEQFFFTLERKRDELGMIESLKIAKIK